MNDRTTIRPMPEAASVIRRSVAALNPFRPVTVEADARAAGVTAPIRRLNLNESAFPPSPRVIAAICDAAGQVNRYPDPRWRALAAAIAQRTGVEPARIVFGNGSDDLLMLLAQVALESGASAVLPTPSFPRYMTGTLFAGASPIAVPVRADGANDVGAMLAAIRPDTKLVLCATPNNPTGAMLDEAALARLASGVPANVLLVIDEAYFEFARHAGGPDALAALAARPGPWAVVRTLSKAYGLAGLRVGYALLSGPDLAEALNRVRGMFNVNVIAQVAALAALEDAAHTQRLLDDCAVERRRLSEGFARLGCAPLPSVANFVSAQLPIPAAGAVKAFFERGILVGAIGPAPFERHIRVTIGGPDDTDAVLGALAEILRS
ncbi:MAG TPA: aminotransferase class I/II-fold pyridoxal phosphate-dependent enzyme [Alphaproteobacteria bacterium]|nr:aminotransferase class I/II-fold pyridoxal phosphate-dependent enzyme [Alphaproteobacteria bacterium]